MGRDTGRDGLPILIPPSERPPDREGAMCAETDPELFFPDAGSSAEPAKALCRSCPFGPDDSNGDGSCLEWALATGETRWGVFGGMSAVERRREQRRRTSGFRQAG